MRSFRILPQLGKVSKAARSAAGGMQYVHKFLLFGSLWSIDPILMVAASQRAVLCVRYSYPIADTIGSDAACFAGPKLARTQRVTEAKIESTATSYG